MTNKIAPFVLFFSLLYFFSCNPDCDALLGLQVKGGHGCEGDQIVLTANPLHALDGRRVFFNDIPAESFFSENMGLIVTIPEGEGLNGPVEIRVEDPDCVDFVALDFNVADPLFFENNAQFVFPLIPEIIIPNVPQGFPPSIENAWLHPENIDYCIWFTLISDGDNCTRIFDPANSFEQSTCFKGDPNSNLLYKENPLSGYIDANDNVFVTIHRVDGEEHFQGRMVSLENVPEKYHDWFFPDPLPDGCDPGLPVGSAGPVPERNHMMVLTSLRNGKQMLIYQQAIDLVGPTCM